jgi:predicted metal-binding membrane protein
MSGRAPIETVLKRDRLIVLTGLAGLSGLAWVYLVWTAARMGEMGGMGDAMMAAHLQAWQPLDFVLMFLMWAIMMVGMMTPSAAPMILLFATISRKQSESGKPFAPTSAFVAGYLAVWTGFSLLAVLLQWALEQTALLSPMMASTSPILGGLLLIGAGIYQWTPYKDVCLKHCRSPLHFIMTRWRTGTGGAFAMGIEHGAFCVGCCWLLMGLLFFGGVMNLFWVAAIAILVLLEKVGPHGPWIARASALVLIAGGIAVLAGG